MNSQHTKFDDLFQQQLGAMVWTLSGLIEAETPTSDKAAIDELGDWMATWAEELDAEVKVHEHTTVGNFVECRWNTDRDGKPLIICCHMDTVHPIGSIDVRPTRTEGDNLFGVGAYDMKGGITVAQTVVQELIKAKKLPERPITLLFTSDEEVGSPLSRDLIEDIAKDAGLVLIMEPGPDENTIVTERKGVGIFQMIALGQSSHSGSNPRDGVNAIVEMAHQIGKITALTDWEQGTTVIPTIIKGGTTHNVIPDECNITINARVRYNREVERVITGLNQISQRSYLKDALLYMTGGFIRPPMEHNELMIKTFETLRQFLPQIEEFSKGGGSDGNFTAAMGIPTLDGLGPTGGGAHSENEHVYLPSLPKRAALLASILCCWPHMPRHY